VNLVKSCLDWLFVGDRRQAERHKSLPLVAYYWDGGEPVAHGILDASSVGLFLLTKQRWYPDTVVAMTLQRIHATASDPHRTVAVNARVVRSGTDGVGFTFIFPRVGSARMRSMPAAAADVMEVQNFLKYVRADKGVPNDRIEKAMDRA
jgi:hypothetical protein